jgi:Restriction endonuclease AspBHI N-terminal
MRKTFVFEVLGKSDLLIDATYAGGTKGNAADDPIDRVVGGGNQGGFRYLGSPRNNNLKLCVLYSELRDPEHELHETSRCGNLILRSAFEDLHHGRRTSIPPFFIFTKGETGRDVVFRGLAVPGAIGTLLLRCLPGRSRDSGEPEIAKNE